MTVRAQCAGVARDEQGRPIAGASITVYLPSTTTKVPDTLYADASGTDTLSNPLTADSAGRFQFYLGHPKRVDLCVTATGYTTYTLEDVDVMVQSAWLAYKASDETVNDSAAMQDDDDLQFWMQASEYWAFRCTIIFTSTIGVDIDFGWSLPGGASMRWHRCGDVSGSLTSANALNKDGADATYQQIELVGVVHNSTTPGWANLQWAQEVANASDTIVYSGSYIIAHRLS